MDFSTEREQAASLEAQAATEETVRRVRSLQAYEVVKDEWI